MTVYVRTASNHHLSDPVMENTECSELSVLSLRKWLSVFTISFLATLTWKHGHPEECKVNPGAFLSLKTQIRW